MKPKFSYVYNLLDVRKTRKKGGVTFTLRVPELFVCPGEFWSIVGPSGCGKSTLLDILALVLAPTCVSRFEINRVINGVPVSHNLLDLSDNDTAMFRRRNIGYVLQSGGLFSFLTVRENILLPAQAKGIDVPQDEFEDLIAALGLGDQLSKKPQYLSGGQRQRVAVARALIHRPSIVLADEPTAAVDPDTAAEIMQEFQLLANRVGSAVMIVTHNRNFIEPISDAIVEFHLTRKSLHETISVTSTTRRTGQNKKMSKHTINSRLAEMEAS